jgi:hypothetical protein
MYGGKAMWLALSPEAVVRSTGLCRPESDSRARRWNGCAFTASEAVLNDAVRTGSAGFGGRSIFPPNGCGQTPDRRIGGKIDRLQNKEIDECSIPADYSCGGMIYQLRKVLMMRRRRPLVEDCHILDVAYLAYLTQHQIVWQGIVHWTNGGSVGFSKGIVDRVGMCFTLNFNYPDDPDTKLTQLVPLIDKLGQFGGVKFYGRCQGSFGCGRLVRHLYLPPRETRFGCRKCHALNYRNRHRQRAAVRDWEQRLRYKHVSNYTMRDWVRLARVNWDADRRRGLLIAPEPYGPEQSEPGGYACF